MASPQLSLQNADPTVQDMLTAERRRLKLELNCHAVGVIQAFNAELQTAAVQLAYTQTFFKLTDPVTLTYVPYLVPYPTLVDAPVHVAGGGGAAGGCLTFPVTVGDECLVCFNDRDMDSWWSTGTPGGPPATARLHAFSDALVIVGFRSRPRVIPDYDLTFAGLRNYPGTVQVGVDVITELARISTETGGTLGTVLQSLVTQLKTLITAIEAITVTVASVSGVTPGTGVSGPGVSGTPNNSTSFTPITAALTTIATTLEEILE